MKVVSQHDYQQFAGEVNAGKSLVESAGYIPAKQKIESFMQAGVNLQLARNQFDYPDGVPDGVEPVVDPTRSGNFDFADASRLTESALERLSDKKLQKVEENTSTGQGEPVEVKKKEVPKDDGHSKAGLEQGD
jgi:hypothetical protein|nr:MAG TPA: hypothetical protein [Microviridae sp.]